MTASSFLEIKRRNVPKPEQIFYNTNLVTCAWEGQKKRSARAGRKKEWKKYDT